MLDIKHRLEAHQRALRTIEILERRITTMQEGLSCPSVTDPSKVPTGQRGGHSDIMPLKLYRIQQLKEQHANLLEIVTHDEPILMKLIDCLKSEKERFVIVSFYFWLIDYQEMGEQLYGDNADWGTVKGRQGYMMRLRGFRHDGVKKLRAIVEASERKKS